MVSRFKGRFVSSKRRNQLLKAKTNVEFARSKRNNSDNATNKQERANIPWIDGERRIIEPALIVKQLQEGCDSCKKELNLTKTIHETKFGLGSMLYILCECGTINKINTGKVHHQDVRRKTRPIFDVNSKTAIAMYDTGMAAQQVTRFLGDINIPGLNISSLKKREREVAEGIKSVSEKSLDASLEEEKLLSKQCSETECSESVSPSIAVQYDMGWQKRGSGRVYNSKSGVGTVIGAKSGKIIGCEVRSKDCRKCKYWEDKGLKAPDHLCFKNWTGSSKSMEPDVGASVVKSLESKSCSISTVIMDDDATTIGRIRSSVDHEVRKWSDYNHVKNHLVRNCGN